MSKRFTVAASTTAFVAAALVLTTAASASAHVEGTATSTAADSYTTMTFSVPHGCDGSPTTALQFHIPSSIIEVTPTVNPNWSIHKTTKAISGSAASASPDTSADDSVAERVTSVTYTATTPLPADERDTFSLSFSLPDAAAGTVVSFPVTQTCASGSVEWNQKQQAGKAEPEHPAPSITLTAATTASADDASAPATSTTAGASDTSSSQPDIVARTLGIAGLIVGAVGVVTAVAARRKRQS